jgi:ribosome maturation factor RimP
LFLERAKLHEIADQVTILLAAGGFSCLDAEWEAHSRTLRLYVDHASGIDLDECAKISNQLVDSPELDAMLPFEFNLEISSPGIERPLRTIDHFQTALLEGFQIDVKLTEKFMNRRKGVGMIVEINPDNMISMKTTEGPWTFPWHMVLKATKVVDWDKIQERPME